MHLNVVHNVMSTNIWNRYTSYLFTIWINNLKKPISFYMYILKHYIQNNKLNTISKFVTMNLIVLLTRRVTIWFSKNAIYLQMNL